MTSIRRADTPSDLALSSALAMKLSVSAVIPRDMPVPGTGRRENTGVSATAVVRRRQAAKSPRGKPAIS